MPRYWAERLTALGCIAAAVYFGIIAFDFPANGGSFPLFAATGTVFLSLIMIVRSFLHADGEMAEPVRLDFSYRNMKPLIVCGLAILYVLAIFEIGYYVSSAAFLFAAAWMIGLRRMRAVVITAVILFPVMYAFFELFLHADMPRGLAF